MVQIFVYLLPNLKSNINCYKITVFNWLDYFYLIGSHQSQKMVATWMGPRLCVWDSSNWRTDGDLRSIDTVMCNSLQWQTIYVQTATICRTDLKCMNTSEHWEFPQHDCVNTDDLLHTCSGLFTTPLLPSRQMFLNKHRHTHARGKQRTRQGFRSTLRQSKLRTRNESKQRNRRWFFWFGFWFLFTLFWHTSLFLCRYWGCV